ncbi:hypothetical protein D1007_36131 [Hordeum vulgare]|nr:hypothetical protein D1007_36131 [Hordeum vulgare]
MLKVFMRIQLEHLGPIRTPSRSAKFAKQHSGRWHVLRCGFRLGAKLWLRSVVWADSRFSTDASPFGWRSWPRSGSEASQIVRSTWSALDELGYGGEASPRPLADGEDHAVIVMLSWGNGDIFGGARAKWRIDFVGL